MMPYGWHDGGWGVMWMILSWGLILALVFGALRLFVHDGERGDSDRHGPAPEPKDVLAERFVKGEIDAEEYHERLRVLEETRPPGG